MIHETFIVVKFSLFNLKSSKINPVSFLCGLLFDRNKKSPLGDPLDVASPVES